MFHFIGTNMTKISSVVREDAEIIASEMEKAFQRFVGKTVLITGAAGFLGAYFLDVLAAFNDRNGKPCCRVVALDNFKGGVPERIEHLKDREDIHFHRHNVNLPFQTGEQIDFILHAASICSPPFYRKFPLETIDTNVNGTRHMLELARGGTGSLLYLSSSEIYGDPDPSHIPTKEDYWGNVSCTGPRACYDESKRLAETLCITYHRLYGVPVKIVRPFNVYGPGQRLDDKRVVPDLLSAVLNHDSIVLYSDGMCSRSFCYVRDAVRGMFYVLLSEADSGAFNVGNEEEITITALAEKIADLSPPPRPRIEYQTSREVDYLTDNPHRRQPDLTKLRALGWGPQVGLTEGLQRTLRSYQELTTQELR